MAMGMCPTCHSFNPRLSGFISQTCSDPWHALERLEPWRATYGIPNWSLDLNGIPVYEEKRTPIIVVGDFEKHEEKEREKMLRMIRGE